MAAPGNYTDKLAEISSELAEANAYMAMALRPEEVLGAAASSLGGLEACVARLAIAIPGITSWGLTDSNTSRLITGAMTSAINEFTNTLGDLFIPLSDDADPDSVVGSIDGYLKAVMSSLTNPLAAVIATQQNLLTSGLSQIQSILYNDTSGKDRGFINQYADRLERIFKMLFLGDSDLHLAGMILYAFEEGIPAIESQLIYLRKLKKLAKTGLEDVANLPDVIAPELMNAAVVDQLICGEDELRKVESTLTRENVFDRKAFGRAQKCVCSGKDQIFSGKIDKDFIEFHAGNIVGLNQAQVKQLTSLRFMPDISFRLNIIQINLYAGEFNSADQSTQTLHNNFMLAADTLEKLADARLGDIMALIVGLLRRQITGVKSDLEAQASGFSGFQDAAAEGNARRATQQANQATLAGQTPSQARAQERRTPGQSNPALATASAATTAPYTSGLAGTPLSKEVKPGSKGAAFGPSQVDVYAYMSAQASAYVVLSAACYIMQGTSAIYSTLDKVLSGESRMVKFIQDFVSGLKSECPHTQGGAEVVAATSAYVRALEDRLNKKTESNQLVTQAAQTMIRRCEEYEQFLQCFKKQMFFGNQGLMTLVSSLANAVAAYKMGRALYQQIKSVVAMYPQLKQMYKNFDLAKMLGVGGAEYNALDTVVGALQCLVLQCDNPYITNLASSAAQQFQQQFAKRKSDALTMGSLDEVPKSGMMSIILRKVQSVMKLIQLIESLTNLSIPDLCAIKTPATNGTDPAKALAAVRPKTDPSMAIDTASWRESLIQSGVKRQPDGSLR